MEAEALESLLNNYFAAWSEPDPIRRRALLETVWDVSGTYTDPQGHAPGGDALDAVIANMLAANPGVRFTLRGGIDHHHDCVRFHWTLHSANGQELLSGMDYGELSPEGKLVKIVGFY